MRVFMLGWEFPPHITGGLGTACYGMTKGLDEIGVEVCFVLPTAVPVSAASHVEFRSPSNLPETGLDTTEFKHVELHKVDAVLQPYGTPATYEEVMRKLARQNRQTGGEESASQVEASEAKAALPSGTFGQGAGVHYDGDLMGQVQRYARLAVELSRQES